MKQLSARWHEWSRYAPGRRLDEHGHFLAGPDGQPGVVIDPVAFHEDDRAHIAELGGAAAIVLTGPARQDEAERCAATLGCPIIAAHEDATLPLPAGLLAFPVPAPPTLPRDAARAPGAPPAAGALGGPSPEVALYHNDTATALVGASAIGHPAGSLSLSAPGFVPAP